MQGIERIAGRIQEEAAAEAKRIEEHAQREAQEILKRASEDADAQDKKTAEAAENASTDIKRRAESTARLNAQKISLAARQAVISEAFELAAKKLSGMEPQKYTEFLAKLISENARGGEEVWFAASDKACGKAALDAANKELSKRGIKPAVLGGYDDRQGKGVILKAGLVATNCTLDALLREARPALTGEVAALLF